MPKFMRPLVWMALCTLAAVPLTGCSQFGDPQPAQPINFLHKVHAGDNQIPCLYCHQNADRAAAATVPPVSTCINCHSKEKELLTFEKVPEDLAPEQKAEKEKQFAEWKPEITKLYDFWSRKQPIPWNKVHDEPDFVYFPHKRHVKWFMACAQREVTVAAEKTWANCGLNPTQDYATLASKPFTDPVNADNVAVQGQLFTCSQCHGPVWNFGNAQRVEPLNMGWCINCHKARIAKAKPEEREMVRARMLDCWTCHK